jgi:glycosyltransferase involved in cell wall biosynthesis
MVYDNSSWDVARTHPASWPQERPFGVTRADFSDSLQMSLTGFRMKYFCWIAGEDFGGCQDYALTMARHLHSCGWKVEVICIDEGLAEEFQRRLANPEIVVHCQSVANWGLSKMLRGRGNNLIEFFFWLKFLRNHKADVLHEAIPWPSQALPVILACACLGYPTLGTFQLVTEYVPRKRVGFSYRLAAWLGARFCAVSENNRMLLRKHYGLKEPDVAVIFNRAAKDNFELPGMVERKQVREKLGLSEKSRMILSVGRLNHQKGHDLIVRGIREIRQAFPEAVFVWAGEGELRADLTRMAEENGVRDHIVMLGHRKDIRGLLAASDLFLFPSRWEGESFALTEAAIAETPIVASNASGIPELLRDGRDAWLFKVDDQAGLVRAVCAALSDPEEAARRAKSAKQRINAYTQEDMFRDTIQLLEKTAARK